MDSIHEYDSTDEHTDEDSSKDNDADSSKDDWLWERLAILCFSRENLKLLEIFKGYMMLFMKSESDTPGAGRGSRGKSFISCLPYINR